MIIMKSVPNCGALLYLAKLYKLFPIIKFLEIRSEFITHLYPSSIDGLESLNRSKTVGTYKKKMIFIKSNL